MVKLIKEKPLPCLELAPFGPFFLPFCHESFYLFFAAIFDHFGNSLAPIVKCQRDSFPV